jgi:hypothetical protein
MGQRESFRVVARQSALELHYRRAFLDIGPLLVAQRRNDFGKPAFSNRSADSCLRQSVELLPYRFELLV